MKRIAAVLALLALAGLAATEAAQAQSRLGAKLGASWADLDDDVGFDAETSNKRGFMGGVYATLPFFTRVAIQPELLYVEKGAEVDIDGRDVGSFDFYYLELPVLGRFEFSPAASPITAFVLAGPYVAYMFDCTIDDDQTGDEFECGGEGGDIVDFNDFDWGFALGGGLGYDIGRGWVFAEARYEMGLRSIEEDDPDATFDDIDLNNRMFGLLIGIEVPLGAKPVR